MAKEKLSIDNSDALQSVQQVSQAVKELYQLLKQVKSALSGIAGTGAAGGAFFESGNAQVSADQASGINLAGLGLPASRVNLAGALQGSGVNVGAMNPSIIAAQNQSAAVNLPARDAQGRFVSAGGGNGSGNGISPGPSPFLGLYGQAGAYGQAAGLAALGVGVHTATTALNLGAEQTLTGRANVQGQFSLGGSIVGGIFGAAAGIFAGPLGIAAGAVAGSSIGGSAGNFFSAPIQNRINAADALQILQRTVGPYSPFSTNGRQARFDEIRNLERGAEGTTGFTSADVATGYARVAEGLLLGGRNPFEKTGTRVYGPTAAELQGHFDDYAVRRDGPRNQLSAARDAIRLLGAGREEFGETITRRAFKRYRNRANDVLKDVSQIYAEQPDVGDNLVDRIVKSGPLKALEYERLQTEDGSLPIGEGEFFSLSADVRSSGRQRRRVSLQARGVGQNTAVNLEALSRRIERDPGGTDSNLYAETQAGLRDANRAAFDEKQATSYGLPAARLQGQQDRLQYLPFSASEPVKLSLQSINLNNKRIGDIDGFVKQRRASGQLSEREELEFAQQREGLLTQNAAAVSTISTGFLDRLPGLSAGAPSFGSRYTSYSAAAANLSLMGGNPISVFGARNGTQLKTQEDYLRAAGGSPEGLAPHSRMSGLDNNGVSGGRVEGLLERIATALERSSGSNAGNDSLHPGEQIGGAFSNLSSRDTGTRSSNPNRH